MTFGERVQSQTQDALLRKVVDNSLHNNILALRLMGKAKRGKGESIKKAIKYTTSGFATSFADLDTFTASQLNTKVRMSYDMRGVRIPVAVSGMEAVANQVSETQVTDLVAEALQESQAELYDALGGYLYGLGTGNSNKDPIGIGAIVDDGTDVATLGTLSRTTYPVLNATRTAATSNLLSLAQLATLYGAISDGTSSSTPTLMISNITVWNLYESLLTPMVRETYTQQGYYKVGMGTPTRGEGLTATQGFVAVTYKGVPWVYDNKATSQNVFMLNENTIDWYGWDASNTDLGYKAIKLSSSEFESLYAESPMSDYHGFNWSGWQKPDNMFGAIAEINLLGNLLSFEPRRNGRLTGVTGV